MISPENVLSAQHADWLVHPATIQLLKNLNHRKDELVNFMSSDLSLPAEEYKVRAARIKEILTVIEHIKTTESFIKYTK
jgi:hypothetical protein